MEAISSSIAHFFASLAWVFFTYSRVVGYWVLEKTTVKPTQEVDYAHGATIRTFADVSRSGIDHFSTKTPTRLSLHDCLNRLVVEATGMTSYSGRQRRTAQNRPRESACSSKRNNWNGHAGCASIRTFSRARAFPFSAHGRFRRFADKLDFSDISGKTIIG